MSKIRLLQSLGSKGGGGAESFFMRLANSLHKEKSVEQHLLVRPNKYREAFYQQYSIPYLQAGFGSSYLDLKTHLAFRRAIKALNPNIVMTWMNRATAFCPNPKKKNFQHIARLGGYYNLKYYKNCDYLVANTPMIVDYLIQQGWPKNKAHYIPNFVPENIEKPYNPSDFSLSKDQPIILAAGRLHINKGFDILIKSIAKIPTGHLLLAGDGPLRQDLVALVNSLNLNDRVTFLGWREDTQSLLATAHIFVCPSRHEPLGNVVLEAWASKTPVIAAKSHGPSMLIDHEISGLLFDIDNVADLAFQLNSLLKKKKYAKNLALEGTKSFQKYFSQKIVTKQYINFFNDII